MLSFLASFSVASATFPLRSQAYAAGAVTVFVAEKSAGRSISLLASGMKQQPMADGGRAFELLFQVSEGLHPRAIA